MDTLKPKFDEITKTMPEVISTADEFKKDIIASLTPVVEKAIDLVKNFKLRGQTLSIHLDVIIEKVKNVISDVQER